MASDLLKWSVSDSSEFKLCPRKFFNHKILGWELAEPQHFLELGRAYDKLLEIWDQQGYGTALHELNGLFPDEHEAADAELILQVYEGTYHEDRMPPIPQKGNQHGFGIDTDVCRITGYVDKISEKEISGVSYKVIVERKTTSEPIEDGSVYWNRLFLDPQIRSYAWYAKQMGWTSGWVCYEVIRKLSSAYNSKLANKKKIPIDEYRSLLASISLSKKLVNRRWIYVGQEMIDEFEQEHLETFQSFKDKFERASKSDNPEFVFNKNEKSCDAFGECEFLPICKREITFEQSPKYVQKKGRF